jgi:hypothetical protein
MVTATCVRAGDMILDSQCLHLCVIDEATHVIVFALVKEMRRSSWDLFCVHVE